MKSKGEVLRIAVTGWNGNLIELERMLVQAHGRLFYLLPEVTAVSYHLARKVVLQRRCHFWLRENKIGRIGREVTVTVARNQFIFRPQDLSWQFREGGTQRNAIRRWDDKQVSPQEVQAEVQELLTDLSAHDLEDWLKNVTLHA